VGLPNATRGAGEIGPCAAGVLPTAIHALAFALQGFVFLLLCSTLREPVAAVLVLGAFALGGAALGAAWGAFAVPHWLDMCFGMLTLGNLGMLLGWWADNDFAPLADRGCCHCAETVTGGVMRPWMWVGMLALSNAAMRWLGRTPAPPGCHTHAMFTGGNAGMVLGMLAGGKLAGQLGLLDATHSAAASFAGMTVGMLAGMLAGTWVAERLFAGLQMLGLAPRWLTSSRTA
jgi:hypothetical protein